MNTEEVVYLNSGERLDEVVEWLQGMKDLPGVTIRSSHKPYRPGNRKEVAEWILQHIPGVPGPFIEVPVGMFNGLVTAGSDVNGGDAAALVEEVMKAAGFLIKIRATNDDSIGLLAIPDNLSGPDGTYRCITALMEALGCCFKCFGIETNKGKMNTSSMMLELNTICLAEKADGDITVMLPGERGLIGAARRTAGFDLTEEAFAAIQSAGGGLKEGVCLPAAFTTIGFAHLERYEMSKMNGVALATSAGIDIPGGLPALGVSPAPQCNGLPLIRPHWSVYPASSQCAAAIAERILVKNTDTGLYVSKNTGETESLVIDKICRVMAATAISTQCKAIGKEGDYGYKEGLNTDDLSLGVGPYSASLKAAPLKFELGEHADGLLSPDFLKKLDMSRIGTGLRNSARQAAMSAFRTIAAGYAAEPERLMCRIMQSALVLTSTGGAPKQGTEWNPSRDTSDLPKRFIINRPVLHEDGTWGRAHGEVSLWWLLTSWSKVNWEDDTGLRAPLISVLISGMRTGVEAMLRASRYLATTSMGLREGQRPRMYRMDMDDHSRGIERLSPLDLARLLDPSKERAAAMELQSLAWRTQNAELRSTDLSILGDPNVAVSMGDLEVIKKVSYTITKYLEGTHAKGWVMPITMRRPSPIDVIISLACVNLGQNFHAHRLNAISMPLPSLDPVYTTITPDLLDMRANTAMLAFLEWRQQPYPESSIVRGRLPSSDASAHSKNTLNGTSFPALMVGLREAASMGYTLSLDPIDMRILANKEMNKQPMVFLHTRPREAVRTVLGVRFEPRLSAKEVANRERARREGLPPPKRDLKDGDRIFVFSTVKVEAKERFVAIGNTLQPIFDYVYTHNVYTELSMQEALDRELQLVMRYKMKGKQETVYLKGNDFKKLTRRIASDDIKVHWDCRFRATTACYPPYVCMAVVDGDYDLIPITAVDCKQSVSPKLYTAPTPGPEVFGESGRSMSTPLEVQFMSNALELAESSGSSSLAASMVSALMLMTPWEMVRTYLVSILHNAGQIGPSNSDWCFGPNASEEVRRGLSLMNIDMITDKLVGESKLLLSIFKIRAENISALFFNTSITASIEQTMLRHRTARYDEAEAEGLERKGVAVHVRRRNSGESLASDTSGEDRAVDDSVSQGTGGRRMIITQRLPIETKDMGDVAVQVTEVKTPEVRAEKEVFNEEEPDIENLLHDLLSLGMEGTFEPESLEEENKGEDVGDLQTVFGMKEERKLHHVRELPRSVGGMADDGFQEVDRTVEYDADVSWSDLTEEEVEAVVRTAEAIPFEDAHEYRMDIVNLNGTASRLVGIIAAKAAMERGKRGGGYMLYRARDLHGGRSPDGDIEGFKWARVPVTTWATVLDRGLYAGFMQSAFEGFIQPPSRTAAGSKRYKNYTTNDITLLEVGRFLDGGSRHSSAKSALTERYFAVQGANIPYGEATYVDPAQQRALKFHLMARANIKERAQHQVRR